MAGLALSVTSQTLEQIHDFLEQDRGLPSASHVAKTLFNADLKITEKQKIHF